MGVVNAAPVTGIRVAYGRGLSSSQSRESVEIRKETDS